MHRVCTELCSGPKKHRDGLGRVWVLEVQAGNDFRVFGIYIPGVHIFIHTHHPQSMYIWYTRIYVCICMYHIYMQILIYTHCFSKKGHPCPKFA